MTYKEVPAKPFSPVGPWTLVPASPLAPGIPLCPAEKEDTIQKNEKLTELSEQILKMRKKVT